MLHTSSRFGKDSGENLLDFFNKLQSEKKEVEYKTQLAKLIIQRDNLKNRAELLKKAINEDSSKLLSEINQEANVKAQEKGNDDNLAELIDLLRAEAYKWAFGVSISYRDDFKITFNFEFNSNGTISKDVYNVTLSKSQVGKGLELESAVLPAPQSLEPKFYDFSKPKRHQFTVIPIIKLAQENLPKVDKFIMLARKHLAAYLLRFDQLADLPSVFPTPDNYSLDYNDDLTEIKLGLVIGDDSSEGNLNVFLYLTLFYDHGEDRPIDGCLKMRLGGEGRETMDEEALEELKITCQSFYQLTISEAVKNSFV